LNDEVLGFLPSHTNLALEQGDGDAGVAGGGNRRSGRRATAGDWHSGSRGVRKNRGVLAKK